MIVYRENKYSVVAGVGRHFTCRRYNWITTLLMAGYKTPPYAGYQFSSLGVNPSGMIQDRLP
jgi:hypothetical protein